MLIWEFLAKHKRKTELIFLLMARLMGFKPKKNNKLFVTLVNGAEIKRWIVILYNFMPEIIFLTTLAINIHYYFFGWQYSIDDWMGGRQAQTAISAYYLVKNGLTIDYITPVLGPPWGIPMEFPTYQLIVAFLVRSLGFPLDQTGRAVSLGFFYLSFIPIYGTLVLLGFDRKKILIIISFLFAAPLYIFWSRTFLIESTALFLSLMYIFLLALYFERRHKKYFYLAIFFGILAALTKITTFTVSGFGVCLSLIVFWYRESDRFGWETLKHYLLIGIPSVGLPLLAGVLWTLYADNQKTQNPFGYLLLSSNLGRWSFGTWAERLTGQTWNQIYDWIEMGIGPLSAVFFLLFFALTSKKYITISAISLICFVAGPAIFTRLYFIHQYYLFANAIYLIIPLGIGVVVLYENQYLRLSSYLISFLLIITMNHVYEKRYVPIKQAANTRDEILYASIKNAIPEDHVILMYAWPPSSVPPYYSQRKAILIGDFNIANKTAFEKSMRNVGENNIGAMITCGKFRKDNILMEEQKSRFGFGKKPSYQFLRTRPTILPARQYDECDLYIKKHAWKKVN